MDSSYSGIIGGIIAVILCTIVSSKISHKTKNGQLKFGMLISGLFWGCLIFSLGSLYVLLFTDYNHERDFFALIGLIVGFGIGAIYSFGEAFKVHGRFDETSIEFHTPWTGSKDELWVNLQQVKFHSTPNWYTLTFESGAKIRLSALLGGHGLVIDHVKSLGHDL
ncbi:hypothetical protein [Colwellia sp. 12G3]|jgi:hypothetical protein|uniref:hypothetical protein n=1 Tax=Colwellia sp. 12G3 TaxID=2058299 RepID=UPI0018E383FA|nr:hypothetical protein [Colwellia sp. 12G3]